MKNRCVQNDNFLITFRQLKEIVKIFIWKILSFFENEFRKLYNITSIAIKWWKMAKIVNFQFLSKLRVSTQRLFETLFSIKLSLNYLIILKNLEFAGFCDKKADFFVIRQIPTLDTSFWAFGSQYCCFCTSTNPKYESKSIKLCVFAANWCVSKIQSFSDFQNFWKNVSHNYGWLYSKIWVGWKNFQVMSCAKTVVLYGHGISLDVWHVFWCKIDNNCDASNTRVR